MAVSDVARRIESAINAFGTARTRKAGWVPSITGFSGYGSVDKAHVLGRVLVKAFPGSPQQNLDSSFL